MLTRRTVITAIEEATYGTDPAMTGANAMLAWDVEIDVKGEVLERAYLRDSLSPMPHVIGMRETELTFKTELVGSNGVPNLEPLFQACGFSTGTIVGTACLFSLLSTETEMKSAALWIHKDGNQHKILGARGTVKFTLEAGKYGIAEFKLNGLYYPVAAIALPDMSTLSQNKPPICYNAGFQIAGFSPVTSKMEIDLATEVARSDSLNATYGVQMFRIAGRKPKMTFDADAVVEASNPFWGDWAASVVDTFAVMVGTNGNGYIVEGIFEYTQNKYADKDGISKYECEAALVSSDPNTQNDEFKIKFLTT